MDGQSNSLDLRKLIRTGLGNFKVLAAALLAVLMLVVIFSAQLQPIYDVKFTVKIGQFDRDRSLEDINVMLEALKRQFSVRPLGARTLEAPSITLIERLDEKRVLSVVVSGPEPEATYAAAKQFASEITALHAQKHAIVQQAAQRQVATLEKVEKGLEGLSAESLPQTAELFLFDRLGDVGNKYLTAYQNFAEISAEPTRVIQMDSVPLSPSRPNWPISIALGVAVGLMLGVAINLIRADN